MEDVIRRQPKERANPKVPQPSVEPSGFLMRQTNSPLLVDIVGINIYTQKEHTIFIV